MTEQFLQAIPLGKATSYKDTYDNSLLFPIKRQIQREEIGVKEKLPFKGYDVWTAFELSWLNLHGKPMVATADIVIPCESEYLIESKSFKLYLNSFNNTPFESPLLVREILISDLSRVLGVSVDVTLQFAADFLHSGIVEFEGDCLDDLEVSCTHYTVNPELLCAEDNYVEKMTIYSHLLKSNCLVTGQPDWGSVQITYSGPQIDNKSLLQYLVSYRNHNEFHEQCVERIFMDILTYCQPKQLTVYARYTRRGGLDINPIRSIVAVDVPVNRRLFRQ